MTTDNSKRVNWHTVAQRVFHGRIQMVLIIILIAAVSLTAFLQYSRAEAMEKDITRIQEVITRDQQIIVQDFDFVYCLLLSEKCYEAQGLYDTVPSASKQEEVIAARIQKNAVPIRGVEVVDRVET